jgi:hypothetical protein
MQGYAYEKSYKKINVFFNLIYIKLKINHK